MPCRSVVIAVLVWSCLGCVSRRAKYGVASGTIAAGVYLVALAPAKDRCDFAPDPEDVFGLGSAACEAGQAIRSSFLTVGIAAIVTGLVSLALIARPPGPSLSEPTYLDDKIVTRLTAQAVLAARHGDCRTVRALVGRIARRDATVVIDDPAVAGCLR